MEEPKNVSLLFYTYDDIRKRMNFRKSVTYHNSEKAYKYLKKKNFKKENEVFKEGIHMSDRKSDEVFVNPDSMEVVVLLPTTIKNK